MVLVMGRPGLLQERLLEALERHGYGGTAIEPDHEEAFALAAGKRAVIFLARPPLLDGEAGPSAIIDVGPALAAAHAPGVEVLIAVLPPEGGEGAIERIAEDGVPYVVLRVPRLFEELGDHLGARRYFFVERGDTMRAMAADEVAAAVVAAVETDDQGKVIDLGEPIEVKDAFERAAALTGQGTRVVALWPTMLRAVRWLARIVRRPLTLPPPRHVEAGHA